MAIHAQPIEARIDWLLQLSRTHSEQYCDPDAYLARKRYRAEHPTEVLALKCMDGRLHLPHATGTPMGIIQPFRNLGGIFDLGWPYLGDLLAEAVHRATSQGRRVLVIITYHFSRGEPARGCAGFNCDTRAARAHAFGIAEQVRTIFGQAQQSVYPLVCGFETDEDALVLHNTAHQMLDLATLGEPDLNSLSARLQALYPDMPEQVLTDLLPLIEGNIRHIAEIRHSQRSPAIEHREWIICVGRGFDFLHVPNVALIVGPYSPNLAHPIQKAADIIQTNMTDRRIPDDGFLLLSSAPFLESGPDRARAAVKARFMAKFAAQVIEQCQPGLAHKMRVRTAVLDWPTRKLMQL
ncbi:MAG: hypothetical protein ACX931_02590 [Saccharospirillum sp.]